MTGPAPARRLSPWGVVVLVCAVVVFGATAALLIATVASSRERVVSFAARGELSGLVLDVGDADVVIAGGGSRAVLDVRRTDRFAFSHDAEVRRVVTAGQLRLHSRCPTTVPRSCSVRYSVVVPDNVPIDVRTDGGTVRLRGYRGSARVTTHSGDIAIGGFCGFSLQAGTESGDIGASAACAPQRLSLRSTDGDVRALVPPGRYQVEAESASGSERVSGLDAVADAPYSIQALSSSGNVVVEGDR
jgi:Putative adhesin